MELSIFVAKALAIMYLSVGLGMLVSQKAYKKMLPKLLEEREVMYLGGLMALIIGLVLVQYHNTWTKDWTVLVTIVGWLSLVKGVMLITFPDSLSWFKPLVKGENLTIMGMMVVIIGLVFAYFGFMV